MKEYCRPAAGQAPPSVKEIRTLVTLQDCVRYLLTSVLRVGLDTCGIQDLYDFLFDRLRAVRQDLTLQSVQDDTARLEILASCVRFHLVFGVLLRGQSSFSQHINSQHQLDCLKSCLLLSPHQSHLLPPLHCLYLLSNMDSEHALAWAVNIQHRSDSLGRSSTLVLSNSRPSLERCVELAQSYRAGNYVRFYRLVSFLPLLLLLAVPRYCQMMLSHAVRVARLAYKSPNIK